MELVLNSSCSTQKTYLKQCCVHAGTLAEDRDMWTSGKKKVCQHMYVHRKKRLLFGINFRMLRVSVKCFSKFCDLGLICSVVLDVRVFMRTL